MPKLDVMVFGKGKGGEDAEDAPPDSGPAVADHEELDAMKDFLSAVEDKDPKAMQLAFARAYEACHAKHEEEAEEPEEY